MHRFKIIATSMLGCAVSAVALGAEPAAESQAIEPAAHHIWHLGPMPISNSMITSWVVALVVIVAVRLLLGRPQLRPGRSQVVIESLVQGVLDLTSPIVGSRVARATFPLLVGLFTFILMQNWAGLFPGVGTVMIYDSATQHWHDFVRPGNADLNLPFALAIVSFFAWLYFILRYAGFKAVFVDLFGNKADRREIPFVLYLFLYVIFFGVGIIEVISILFRPVSLSFRLFGNVFGGENLMHSMSELTPWSRFALPIPFYFLEMLIGFVQALVFTLLVSVYIGLICNHGDEHAEHREDAGADHH